MEAGPSAGDARDEAIREAAAADMSQTAIASAVGLSRMQVYRILNGK